MKSKFLLVLVAVTLTMTLFSCQKPSSKSTFTAVNEAGTAQVVASDENGFIKTNEKSSMIEYITGADGAIKKDDSGKDVTKITNFPSYIKHGNTVECYQFKLTLPDTWEMQKSQSIKLTHKETKAEITFTVRTNETAEKLLKEVEDLYADWDAGFTKETVQLSFGQAIKLESTKIKPNAKTSFYVFAHNGNAFLIRTTVYDAMSKNVDCLEVINSVKFRSTAK
ncbi:hypothetical protein SDC9_107758 [bioreactor metagenome]|uniref:Lipoprotein n=1 Tax=bioreactor metagenome TaxID=1076179 RepID=A0A645BGM6_9ZZZZ